MVVASPPYQLFLWPNPEFPKLALCPGVTLLPAWPGLLTQRVASLGNDSRWNEPILFWLADTWIYRTFWHSALHHKSLFLVLKRSLSGSMPYSLNKVYFWMVVWDFHFCLASCNAQRDVRKKVFISLNCFFQHIQHFKLILTKTLLVALHLVNLLTEQGKLIDLLV